MTRKDAERHERLAADIRHQFADLSTTRFLRAMPAFRVIDEIPDHLKVLLDRLDAGERRAAGDARQ